MSVSKMVLIDDKHQVWIMDGCLNLSRYLRKKIDEDMKEEQINKDIIEGTKE